jgi:hypothetical protein
MASGEEGLEVHLLDGKEDRKHRVVLEVEDANSMLLSELGDTILSGIESSGDGLCETVCCVVESPVEHFYQERVLLQDSAVQVIGEGGRIRHLELLAQARAFLESAGRVTLIVGQHGSSFICR